LVQRDAANRQAGEADGKLKTGQPQPKAIRKAAGCHAGSAGAGGAVTPLPAPVAHPVTPSDSATHLRSETGMKASNRAPVDAAVRTIC
jgi:hypothetical protein